MTKLRHSPGALRNIDKFYAGLNDIDIYVEDTDYSSFKFYTIIFRRIFKDKYKVEKVFPLGGSDQVLQKYSKLKQDKSRKRLFVVDGDLNILYKPKISLNNQLLKLGRYCIENYLIEEKAIIEVADEEAPDMMKEEFSKRFNFQAWYEHNDSYLVELFKYYAIAHFNDTGEKTVREGAEKFKRDCSGFVCSKKTETRIGELKDKLKALNIDTESELKKINSQNPPEGNLEIVVSGKDFLLNLVRTRICDIIHFRVKNEIFKQKLARKSSFKELAETLKNY